MKQFLKTGKKALSVFMAVLMAMTALAIVSPESSNAYAEGEEVCEHKAFDAWFFKVNPNDSNSYVKEKKCKFCDYTELEKTDGVENVYYSVTYKNDWVTDTYADVKNDKLAATHKTETLKTEYVLSGEAAAYKGIPVREKDFNSGKYDFTGWEVDTGSLDSVTENIVATAQFSPVSVKFTNVSFYDKLTGTLYEVDGSSTQTVEYGDPATPPADPVLENHNFEKRIFTGWDYDYNHIYKDGGILAEYDSDVMSFTLVYCDWDGTEIKREPFKVNSGVTDYPTKLERSNTNEFIYEFSGKWYLPEEMEKLKSEDQEVREDASPINLDCVSLPVQYASLEEGSEIKVIARYYQKLKIYFLDLKVFYMDGYPAADATVQIAGADKSLLAVGKTNSEGQAHLEMTYSTSYTISVTDLQGSAKKEVFTIAFTTGPYNLTLGSARQYHEGGKDRCTCTCHSVFGGIHIWLLNVLYGVFKMKYTCCYDMYATHGDKLKYTP